MKTIENEHELFLKDPQEHRKNIILYATIAFIFLVLVFLFIACSSYFGYDKILNNTIGYIGTFCIGGGFFYNYALRIIYKKRWQEAEDKQS